MSDLGTYTFLPWLRQGIANKIQEADGDNTITTRATVNVKLNIKGDPVSGTTQLSQQVSKDVALYGPGDIVGIDNKAIIKVEPRNWITNFETNYFPYIDFYDEDFPWRYTPAKPGGPGSNRLRPWIALVVLKEGKKPSESEFQEGGKLSTMPLPFIIVEDNTLFPPKDELWAWAHVHANRSLTGSPGEIVVPSNQNGPVITKFEQILNQNPDLAYSRILCPRKLEENTGYHAFLVPVFESGRLAGLGLDPAQAPFATHCSWEDYPSGTKQSPTYFPFYHRWYFRTSTEGDFEYLVRLLEPKPMDSRVGRRPMDVQKPGANLPGIDDPDLGGVLKLGGALQIPYDTLKQEDKDDVDKYENWDQPYPHPFQEGLAAFVNLNEDYSEKSADDAHQNPDLPQDIKDGAAPDDPNDDPDPLITPPIYGKWHAQISRLLKDENGNPLPQNENWVHELNLDPRFRVAAGFGTDVVQENQESYMDAAWEQVGDILKANQQIKWAIMAKEVSGIWHQNHLGTLRQTNEGKFFTLTAPVDRRLLVSGSTRFHAIQTSIVPRVAVSAPIRRMMRPRARIVSKAGFTESQKPEALVTRLNNREVLPAPPKVTPEALPTFDEIAEEVQPKAPKFIKKWTLSVPWLKWIFLAVAILLLVVLGFIIGWDFSSFSFADLPAGPAGIVGGGFLLFVFLFLYFNNIGRKMKASEGVKEENQNEEWVDDLPNSSDFVLTLPGQEYTPKRGGQDSPTAARFKVALKDNFRLIEASKQASPEPTRNPLDLPTLITGTFEGLNPELTVPKRALTTIFIPPRIKEALFEIFEEAMAYPEFDMPMYKPLTEISADLFLPNIQYVEQNSISLLETNQRFIESYMVGLNHEFGRELLWREYPTDQRGSYFRQFWDISSFLDRENKDDETLREELKDIPELHYWSRFSDLGDHDHREKPGENEEELVLVIRGELLKKYPTAVIYAHRAKWQETNGSIDKTKPRQLVEILPSEEENPPESKVLSPLYEAKVDPDIYFFGFDLTATEAKGETNEDPDDPGWFFVIKERPGEPRFGFDIDQDGSPGGDKSFWNDVSWLDVPTTGTAATFVAPTPAPSINWEAPSDATSDQNLQHTEDQLVIWDNNVSAAEMAYIMYQVPVLVAIHAGEMLPS